MSGFPRRFLLFFFACGFHATMCAAVAWPQQTPPYAKRTVPLECQIEGGDDQNFRYLAAQCWLPPSQKIRGILCVVLHPDGTNGRTLAESGPWQELAAAHECALLGVSIVESSDATKHWFVARMGSGRALLAAIDRLAVASGHPEMQNVPIALAGVCAAGQFSYEFAAFAPHRTACFVTIGGAKHDLSLAATAARVPALLVVTPDRGPAAAANMEGLDFWGRFMGATWIQIEGNIASYDAGNCQPQIKEFLNAQMASRQPNNVAQASRYLVFGKRGSGDGHPTSRVSFLSTLLSSNFTPAAGPTGSSLSFLGKPLPALAQSSAAPADLKITEEAPVAKTAFSVQGSKSPAFDEIAIPSPFVKMVEARKTGDSEWQITFSFDSSRIPSGGFHCELPVRFIHRGVPLLGGLQVPLRGTVERDIYCSPQTLRLASGDQFGEGTVRLKSRSGTPIGGLEVEAVIPQKIAVRFDDEETNEPRVTLASAVAARELVKPTVGYIILRAKSKDIQLIKIPFYGSISL